MDNQKPVSNPDSLQPVIPISSTPEISKPKTFKNKFILIILFLIPYILAISFSFFGCFLYACFVTTIPILFITTVLCLIFIILHMRKKFVFSKIRLALVSVSLIIFYFLTVLPVYYSGLTFFNLINVNIYSSQIGNQLKTQNPETVKVGSLKKNNGAILYTCATCNYSVKIPSGWGYREAASSPPYPSLQLVTKNYSPLPFLYMYTGQVINITTINGNGPIYSPGIPIRGEMMVNGKSATTFDFHEKTTVPPNRFEVDIPVDEFKNIVITAEYNNKNDLENNLNTLLSGFTILK